MHDVEFLQDMAVVMMLAGLVTILFHRFRQPVVLVECSASQIESARKVLVGTVVG